MVRWQYLLLAIYQSSELYMDTAPTALAAANIYSDGIVHAIAPIVCMDVSGDTLWITVVASARKELLIILQRLSREMEILQNIPVITVSHFLKSQMVDAGYPIDSIHVLHLFSPEIANISPPPPTGVPRFIFLGRLVPLKGLEWLLRSIRQVQVPIHLDIAGEGPQESKMKHLVQRLQLEDRVTFHGWVDQDRVNQLIQSARALIFPSLWHEPGGTVAFEAMSQSRAVIMSRVGGMPEVVLSETNGLLIEPNNILELAQCIEKLALDWSFAKELGEGGRKLAATKFTFDQHMDQLIQLYKQTTVSLPHLTGQL